MDLQTLQLKQSKIMHDAQSLLNLAEKEERKLTDDEEKSYDGFLKSLEGVEKQIAKAKSDGEFMDAFNKMTGGNNGDGNGRGLVIPVTSAKSWGDQFVASKGYTDWRDGKATRRERWSTGSVELVPFKAATLTEDPASGGALVVPTYVPGVVPGPILRIVVADLFAPGTTDSNLVSAMVETGFTNNAAPVGEGGVKPESALTFTAQGEPVRKVAHWIPVTEEMLEDVPQVRSYIDGRLRYGVLRKEDQQLLFGTGVAPEFTGLLLRAGLAAPVARVDPATNADVILKQISAIETASGYMVTGIVLHPSAWNAIVGAKASDGTYLSAGGPFTGPAGPMLWGRAVSVTDQMLPATEGVVGAFKTAGQVFRHGGIRVEASNSHQDFFIKNLVAIRAEERLALAVYRPGAFGKVTGLTTL